MFVVGVDGCRAGWVAVALQDGGFAGAAQFASFADIARACAVATVIGVDIPVGLLDSGERICDRLARELVGARRTSVFVTPPRPALMMTTYEDASAECRRRTAFGISRQMWALRDKILEVGAVVREERSSGLPPGEGRASTVLPRVALTGNAVPTPEPKPPPSSRSPHHKGRYLQHGRGGSRDSDALRRFARIIVPDKRGASKHRAGGSDAAPPIEAGRVIEVHPEASFRELAGAPLASSKKTYDGTMMRMELLRRGGIRIPNRLEIGSVHVDDVLDAAAAAWTANRYAARCARSLPDAARWQYDGDRVVAIWI